MSALRLIQYTLAFPRGGFAWEPWLARSHCYCHGSEGAESDSVVRGVAGRALASLIAVAPNRARAQRPGVAVRTTYEPHAPVLLVPARLARDECVPPRPGTMRLFGLTRAENCTVLASNHTLEPCKEGFCALGGEVNCTLCAEGTFQPDPRQTKCHPCLPGTFARHEGWAVSREFYFITYY